MTITSTSLGFGQITTGHTPFEDWATRRNTDWAGLNDLLSGTSSPLFLATSRIGINLATATWATLGVHASSATVATAAFSQGNGSGNVLELNNGNTDLAGNLLVVTGGGKLGVGATAPAELLEIEDASATTILQISNTATDGDPALAFALSGTKVFTMGVDDGDADKFKLGTTAIGTNTRLTVDASGNVGIGVSDPDALLEVAGQIKLTGGSPGASKVLTSDANGLGSWITAAGGDFANGGDTAGAARTLGNIDAYDLHFETTNTTRMTILAAGNVGIGVSDPDALLEVAGQIKVTGGSPAANSVLTSDANGVGSWSATANLTSLEVDTLKVTTSAGANKILVSDADGDLTYSLTPNLTSLEVDTLKVTTGAGANAVLVSDADGDASWSLTPNLTSLEIDTLKLTTGAAANKLLVSDADGDASWTATPTLSTLEVGTVKITGGSPGAGKILQSDADGDAVWAAASAGSGDFSDGGDVAGAARTLGNTDAYDFGFETTNVTRMTIQAAGRVGIGAVAPTDGTLHVQAASAGTVTADNGGDEIVVEGTEAGISIFSANGNNSSIFFGAPGGTDATTDNRNARINWNYDSSTMQVGPSKADAKLHLAAFGAGVVGVGPVAPTDGTLHVQTATAGSVAASVYADELVLETSADGGMSILTGSSAQAAIYFGCSVGNERGILMYDHGAEAMIVHTENTERMRVNATGLGVGINNPTARLHAVGTDMIFDCNNFYKKYSGNTTMTIDYLGRLSIFEAIASPTAGTVRTGGMLNIDIGSGSNVSRGMDFHSARPDSYGQMHTYTQRSPSPANNDAIMSLDIRSTGIRQTYYATSGQLQHRCVSIGTAGGGDGRTDDYQSEWRFYVCNSVDEAGDYDGSLAANVYGLVNYSGAFVDSSAGMNKLFDDNYTDRYGTICDTLSSLRICTYRSAKGQEDRAYSFGTTAEEFYEIFGIGEEPQMITNKDGVEEYRAGIAAKDPAFLALAACQELHARLKALEKE